MIDRRQLLDALLDAFPRPESFWSLLDGIGKRWYDYAPVGSLYADGLMCVIVAAESGHNVAAESGRNVAAESDPKPWLPLLLKAVEASESRHNAKFVAFLAAHPALAAQLDTPARERYLELLLSRIRIDKKPAYSPLDLTAQLRRQVPQELQPWQDLPYLDYLCRDSRNQTTTEEFTDARQAFHRVARAILLGAPGAGKTTTLYRRVADLAEEARRNPQAPLPVLLELRGWLEERQPFAEFIAAQAPAFPAGAKAAWFLDGLNEMPTHLRASKAAEIRQWIALRPPDEPVTVSCRLDDYVGDLDLRLDDRLTLQELKPWRVREVLQKWLGSQQEAGALFWEELAGEPELAKALESWLKAGSTEESFWFDQDWKFDGKRLSWNHYWLRREHAFNPRSLLKLAANPFLLTMLYHVWHFGNRKLPTNRAALVAEFVTGLLARENLLESRGPTTRGSQLLAGLTALAWHMQTVNPGAQTAIASTEVGAFFNGDESLSKHALDANLLDGGGELRFVHQLLQEYFAALALRDRLTPETASQLWPADRWWERNGWEETAVLLVGLSPSHSAPVLQWLAGASPVVAAQCALASGVTVPGGLLQEWKAAWLPRLTRAPQPQDRAAVGRALGRLNLDDRRGVGLKGGLPDIDWVRIPGGPFVYQEREAKVGPFHIARYPVTNAQYQAFLDDPEGHARDEWWKGLTEPDRRPAAPSFPEPNHPRETVSWFEAMAFCAWLSHRLGFEVRLPDELEWERAARGIDGREYPWGDGYKPGFANINERIDKVGPHNLQRTSAVGIYPQGASAEGVMDLCGNVWEWCLNEHAKPERKQRTGTQPRVLRGGSWDFDLDFARAAFRCVGWLPNVRGLIIGFRVVCSSPIR